MLTAETGTEMRSVKYWLSSELEWSWLSGFFFLVDHSNTLLHSEERHGREDIGKLLEFQNLKGKRERKRQREKTMRI